jgi:PAS domain S-box-containing protein
MCIAGADAHFRRLNPAFQSILGCAPDSLVGKPFTSLVHPDDVVLVEREILPLARGRATGQFEVRCRRHDGSFRWIAWNVSRVGTGGLWFATGRDVTERKANAEASTLLDALLNSSLDLIYFKDLNSRMVKVSRSFAERLGVSDPGALRGKTDFDLYTEEHARPAVLDEQRIIQTGEPMIGKLERETYADGHFTWALTSKMPWRDATGKIIGTFGISRDVTAIKEAETDLVNERLLLRTLIDNLPDVIYAKDREGRKILANQADLRTIRVKSEAEAIGKSDFDMFPREIAEKFWADDRAVLELGQPVVNREEYFLDENGDKRWLLTCKLPRRDQNGKIIGLIGIGRDITKMKEAEIKLEQVHKQLVDTSRQAGMAEVATGILHNVGNILNSVNVSATVAKNKLQKSRVTSLVKAASLMREHAGNLGSFLTTDPKGKQLPEYLGKLADILLAERDGMFEEMIQLGNNIEHIKVIVAMQQDYAKVRGIVEKVKVIDLVEDALRMNSGALPRHGIEVVRQFDSGVPDITVDKHKVILILVNLIRNAKYACDESGRSEKTLTMRVNGGERVRISVVDNGIGIPKENLTRIFNHGFTTREDGHGFGLHSSACSAKELGGSLIGFSDGPGTGASFVLELPLIAPSAEDVAVSP